jgi:hypothetical protein
MADINGNSRLLVSGEQFRNQLIPRNLYNLDNEYESTDKLSLRNKSKVADSIASILSVIPQYQHFNIENSLLLRGFSNTPLTEIGTRMLGQQMFYNSASHLAQQNLPTVNLSNVLKGKSPFEKNINNTITINNQDDKSLLDKAGGFIGKIFFNTDAVGNNYPFKPSLHTTGSIGSTNADYIKNTGKGQLTYFYQGINLNVYKQIGPDDSSSTILQNGVDIKQPIQPVNNIINNRIFFNFNNKNAYPYLKKPSNVFIQSSIDYANNDEKTAYSYITLGNTIQEYAPNYDFIYKNFGTANKSTLKEDINNFVDNKSDITTDDIGDKLVWGRDGINDDSKSYLAQQHGNADDETNNLNSTSNIIDYRINGGLLEYTKNLLNASSGYFVDITRKVFKESNNEIIGFNGSPLWQANNSNYASESKIAGKTGIRQHTMVDQYDRFAKTIRYKGNIVYGGNQNSVIYKTVIPKIHPEWETNDNGNPFLNPKNMMFSIENLAIVAIPNDSYGIIDDEWHSIIPLSEVGPFKGRIMWFPPYDIQLNETASAKYESTVMVGRNEPMYNYMNSERTATLSFTLLIDYPEQLRNYQGENQNKNIADFFAFGGNELVPQKTVEDLELSLKQLQDKITQITGPTKQADVAPISAPEIKIFFPNDIPTDAQVNTVIEDMYNNPLHYEIREGCISEKDGNGFGLNDSKNGGIYEVVGLSADTENRTFVLTGSSIPQYNISNKNNSLNKILSDVYSNPENRKYYDIIIDGGSSKLYQGKDEAAYNKALGDRRIAAAKHLVEERLKAIFKVSLNELGINIVSNLSSGSADGSAEGATVNGITLKTVKEERRASINIKKNNKNIESKKQIQNTNQQQDVQKIKNEIAATEYLIKQYNNQIIPNDNIFATREKAILNGFESIIKNNYYPAFHTQTPENFHRRLTFLQQCTRQGSAKQFIPEIDAAGTLRARNSVFGRQPICILRVGDFFYTKVIIENVTFDYNETTWDMNPEGFGMQPMMAKITLQMKLIGGQSLEGPIDALQNAVSFNQYANSTFSKNGMYARPSKVSAAQMSYKNGISNDVPTANSSDAVNKTLQTQNTQGK